MTDEELKKKKPGYTTIAQQDNSYEAHMALLPGVKDYVSQNPTVANGLNYNELSTEYQKAMGQTQEARTGISSLGGYTYDLDAAKLAEELYGASYSPADNGRYYVEQTRPTAADASAQGLSGADEDLLSDTGYAVISTAKTTWNAANTKKQELLEVQQELLAAGRTAEAEALQTQIDEQQATMDEAHYIAEADRAGAGYLGGADGSGYFTLGELGISRKSGDGATGGSGTSQEDYLRQMYQAMTDAQIAELTAAYQKNVAALDNAESGMEGRYQDARNQTAGASELAARNFNEYAAARGLNTGTGGQAELARNVTLQNNLNSLNAEEAQAYAELELARANADAEYNLAVAQARANGQYDLAEALYQEQVKTQEMLAAQQEAILQQSQSQQSQLAGYGESWLQSGVMPSAAMLEAMGLTEADAQAYLSAMTAGSAVSNLGTGANRGSDKTPIMSLTTAKQAANNGVFTDDVLSVLYANGYTDTMLQAIYGYTPGGLDPGGAGLAGVRQDLQRIRANGASSQELWYEIDSLGLSEDDKLKLAAEFRLI